MKSYIYIALLLVMPVLLQGQYTWERHAMSATGGKQNTSTYSSNTAVQHYEANSISNNTYTGSTGFLFPEIILLDIRLDIKALLEGPFNGTSMNTNLNNQNQIPFSQPYSTTPWNYAGTESVPSIPNTNIVDWVLIELRDASDAASATPATVVERQAAFLLNNGEVVGLDGNTGALQCTSTTITNNLFVVVYHRNHLAIMSANPLTKSAGIYSYDFTTALNQAHNDGQKNLGGAYFGMIAGNSHPDGTIDDLDKLKWQNDAGKYGYLSSDNTLNGQVDNRDKNDTWNLNKGESSTLPE